MIRPKSRRHAESDQWNGQHQAEDQQAPLPFHFPGADLGLGIFERFCLTCLDEVEAGFTDHLPQFGDAGHAGDEFQRGVFGTIAHTGSQNPILFCQGLFQSQSI